MNVNQAEKITIEWILESVDLDAARARFEYHPPSGSENPHKFEMPALGAFRLDPFGEIDVLVEIAVENFKPSEGDWDYAMKRPEFPVYVQWQKDGCPPPPLSVVKTDKGNLVTQNRRRWLAAREAGAKTLRCWYSPTHPDHFTSPKWRITEEGKDYYKTT
jgi:hypothetical protein